jgi:hypothetical protein
MLLERFQFVIAEKEVVPDLVDDLRSCDTCGEWCSPYVFSSNLQYWSISNDYFTLGPMPFDAIAARISTTCRVCNRHWRRNPPRAMVGRVPLAPRSTRILSIVKELDRKARHGIQSLEPNQSNQPRVTHLLFPPLTSIKKRSDISKCGRIATLGARCHFSRA